MHLLGILREPVYSPGKVAADRNILHAVAAALPARDHVRVISAAEELPESPEADVVFTMAQGPSAVASLHRWQDQGVRVINAADAIAGCHRHRMIAAFARAGVRQPLSTHRQTATPGPLPDWIQDGAWVKRGDVHATNADDVVFVDRTDDASAVLTRFARRGITDAILQRHVAGTVVKFYAVRHTFFSWFPSDATHADLSTNAIAAMRTLAEEGATALGLEIFGGDCVQQADGEPVLIDLNDWPSYGPCRSEAAQAIAHYVATAIR